MFGFYFTARRKLHHLSRQKELGFLIKSLDKLMVSLYTRQLWVLKLPTGNLNRQIMHTSPYKWMQNNELPLHFSVKSSPERIKGLKCKKRPHTLSPGFLFQTSIAWLNELCSMVANLWASNVRQPWWLS